MSASLISQESMYKSIVANTVLIVSCLMTTLCVQAAESVIAPTSLSTQNSTVVAANADTVNNARPSAAQKDSIDNTLAAQLKPSNDALSAANQKLLSQNAQLQRQVNDLQTQANVLVYESQGQLFLYGAFTVLISLLVGIFVSWLVFVRRERW